MTDVSALESGIRTGDRAMLARGITLVESRRANHQTDAQELLTRLMPYSGKAVRVGITGVPGVGKSTFIDGFGKMLTGLGHRVAVLAVDPTSSRTGGSILGDKTRMQRLAVDDRAFIRPSPTSGTLGGVARRTREAMVLVEAAGYDVVLVETVGVGQSEIAVADMVDVFVALMLPGAGDELQGIKKGLLEIADIIAVNKADGDRALAAKQAAASYRSALRIVADHSSAWAAKVLTMSGLEGAGLDELWATIGEHRQTLLASGEHDARRREQRRRWLWSLVEGQLLDRLRAREDLADLVASTETSVEDGTLPAGAGADRLIDAFLA